MQYDPKLKLAMEEIKAICDKHDCAAVVILHRPGFSEYLQKINPSYSCAQLQGGSVRIKSKASEIGAEQRNQTLADTSNMFSHFAYIAGMIAINMIDTSKKLDELTRAEHTRGDHTSHDQQNN